MSLYKANEIISQLGHKIGLPELRLNHDNACTIQFNNDCKIDIHFSDDTNALYLSSTLNSIREEEKLSAYKLMLTFNTFGFYEENKILSLNFETEAPSMLQKVPLENVSESEFETVLIQFIESIEKWIDIIQQINNESIKENETFHKETLGAIKV